VSAYAYAYACVVSSLCPVYFSSPAILRLPSTTLAILSQPTHTGLGVSRPVKSRSYRHSGRTDSTHRCCYECYQRSQFTEDTPSPLSCPGLTPCVSSQVTCANHTYVGEAYNSGQTTSLTQYGVPWITAPRVALPYIWLPAKHFPHHSAPEKVGRPLAQDPSHRHICYNTSVYVTPSITPTEAAIHDWKKITVKISLWIFI